VRFTRLSPGPARPGRPVTCCSCRAHDDLSLPGYGRTPQTGPVRRGRGGVAPHWATSRARPAASLTAPASRRSATSAVCCPCPRVRGLAATRRRHGTGRL